MFTLHSTWPRAIAFAAGLTLIAAACSDPTTARLSAPATVAQHHGAHSAASAVTLTAADRATIAQLRATTTAFMDLPDAQRAGWSTLVPDGTGNPCFSDPTLGGMGFHYLNERLLNDPTEDPLQPELLLFEPQRNGRFQLVAVEYAVKQSDAAEPPVLFGQQFHTFGDLWILHVWHFENNPSGIFTDFNPHVTCAFAPAA